MAKEFLALLLEGVAVKTWWSGIIAVKFLILKSFHTNEPAIPCSDFLIIKIFIVNDWWQK